MGIRAEPKQTKKVEKFISEIVDGQGNRELIALSRNTQKFQHIQNFTQNIVHSTEIAIYSLWGLTAEAP